MKLSLLTLLLALTGTSLAQAQPPTLPSNPQQTSGREAEVNLRWLADVGGYISRRLTMIYGGAETLSSIARPGHPIRGMIGVSGNIYSSSESPYGGDGEGSYTYALPFQFEMNTDKTMRISVSLVSKTFSMEADHLIGSVAAFNFTYDNRTPNRVDKVLSFDADISLPMKTFANNSGWIGPRGTLKIGGRWVNYDVRNLGYSSYPTVESFDHSATGVAIDAQAGVAFDRRFLKYSLTGFLGYRYSRTGKPNYAEWSADETAAAEGRITSLGGQSIARHGVTELNLSRPMGKKGGRVGLFYQGSFARKATFQGTFDRSRYNITGLELAVPHRVGLRLDLSR